MIEETPKKHYMAWMTLAMLDFVTIIRFEAKVHIKTPWTFCP
ncbi:hypothetical protein [Lactobacillus delbrueckii]